MRERETARSHNDNKKLAFQTSTSYTRKIMGRFNLHQRHEDDFENIVWHLCVRIFGNGTKKFAPGKDGGRDALFEGTAQAYPSVVEPWKGKIVIQAKHTKSPVASCSDSEFKRLMEADEAPKINNLKARGELDHYICFTNRKESGVAGRNLELALRDVTGLPTLTIAGIDTIEHLLTHHSDLIEMLGLRMLAPGLTIHPQDLESLINYFDANVDLFSDSLEAAAEPVFQAASFKDKNEINSLSDDYFQSGIVEDSMPHFKTINAFLSNPRNGAWRKRYTNVARQFRNKYLAHRADFGSFEQIFENIFDRLQIRGQLQGQDALIYIFLHYMYCQCDLGRRTPDEKQ